MSRPKFMVLKLKDLRMPALLLLAVVAAFSVFMFSSNEKQTTFAPDTSYEDGMYIANLAFTNANLDLIVTIADSQITSVTFDDFDESERTLYSDLTDSLSFVNEYVTSTQSITLPENSDVAASTTILMDALSVALATDNMAAIETTYQTPLLEDVSTSEISPEALITETTDDMATDTTPIE